MPKFLTNALPWRQASLRNHNKALGLAKKLTEPASPLEGVDVSQACWLLPVGEVPEPPGGLEPDVLDNSSRETC